VIAGGARLAGQDGHGMIVVKADPETVNGRPVRNKMNKRRFCIMFEAIIKTVCEVGKCWKTILDDDSSYK